MALYKAMSIMISKVLDDVPISPGQMNHQHDSRQGSRPLRFHTGLAKGSLYKSYFSLSVMTFDATQVYPFEITRQTQWENNQELL